MKPPPLSHDNSETNPRDYPIPTTHSPALVTQRTHMANILLSSYWTKPKKIMASYCQTDQCTNSINLLYVLPFISSNNRADAHLQPHPLPFTPPPSLALLRGRVVSVYELSISEPAPITMSTPMGSVFIKPDRGSSSPSSHLTVVSNQNSWILLLDCIRIV